MMILKKEPFLIKKEPFQSSNFQKEKPANVEFAGFFRI